jgi:type IV secretion system protein VirB10
MTDKISGIEESTTKDRASLNVGGRSNGNNLVIIVIFVVVSLCVLGTGLYYAFRNVSELSELPDVVEAPIDNNFNAGADVSKLKDSNNYFEAIRKEKKRKDDLATIKKLQVEKEKIDAENAALVKPKEVTRSKTTSRESKQPKPKVSKSRSSNKDIPLTPAQRKLQGSVLVSVRGSQSVAKPPQAFSKAFNASVFENGQAGLRPDGSLDFLLIHGSSLPCALYTQIISDYEGFVTCRITQDVYSANGAALLIEKGSLVSGTQSVAMEQGKARIFTSWADVETPLGATIRIDSLGTGQLGAAGIEAWIDNHFQERFGGAILLSFVDDALGAISEKIAGNQGSGVDNSTDNASDMASKALESSINIKATGYAFIGQRINILVARDIDMSSIYRFEEEE